MESTTYSPVNPSQRYVILDALRGFALIGICLANYPEFSLYTFQPESVAASMPTAGADAVVKFLLAMFVDGKFYTIFSLLFGIGFSIIISRAEARGGNGISLFYRRMSTLLLIGFAHMMLVWSGDILALYALVGMLLPLFRRASDRTLLAWAAVFLVLPVVVDTAAALAGVSLSAPAVRAQWYYCREYGITEENFGYWLRDAESYRKVLEFLVQGALVRVQEFVDGNRYFKVAGLFLIGYCVGRRRMYANLGAYAVMLRRVALLGLTVGLPLSVFYAADTVEGRPAGPVLHDVLYLVSVYPVGFAYVASLCLLYLRRPDSALWRVMAAPGRMALSNYLGQSVVGMFLFYGIGLGLGAGIGLWPTELVALGVVVVQAVFSAIWLSHCRFGPVEWLWRMANYGRYIRLMVVKERRSEEQK